MGENIQKYENWRAITESDYVTMFIKTWFAFVATLRELYPKDDLEDVIGKGDKVFLNPYLDDFQEKYYTYNTFGAIMEYVLRVYKFGREFTLENIKFTRFYAEDYFSANKSFFWELVTEDFECSLKYAKDFELSLHVKYLNDAFSVEKKPLIIIETIDISDLLSSGSLSAQQRALFLDDETAYLQYVISELSMRVSERFISNITHGNYFSRLSEKDRVRLNSVTLSINAAVIAAISSMKEPSTKKEAAVFSQAPCNNFIYRIENREAVPEIETYNWFLNFVYFLRNALFHEIIDPLDAFWQELFKYSYLALKEILDGNLLYFEERKRVTSLLFERAWKEIRDHHELYVPNYDDEVYNGELEISLGKYMVAENDISIKAEAGMDYWYDEHTQKRMIAKISATINRSTWEADMFKMRFVRLDDVPMPEFATL